MGRRLHAPRRRGVISAVMALALIGVGIGMPAPEPAAAAENRSPAQAGARLPSTTSLASLPGTKIYVAPNGSDSGAGTASSPLKTLPKAVAKAAAGSVIVVRGGTYPMAANTAMVTKKLTIIAYPGETPVFDGAIAAGKATTEGSLRWISYRPMPAKGGEGLGLTALPVATFANGSPTGLAASRGWRCVANNGSTYATPAGSGTGCPSGTTPRVITGYYPDQAWANGKPLVQVLSKAKVVPGTFYVERSASSDAAPPVSRLYLSSTDSADMGKVAVSGSSGSGLILTASGSRVEGIKIVRHSPAWPDAGIRVSFAANDVAIRNVELSDVASTALRLMGGDAAKQAQITKRTTVDRVSISRAGWLGVNATYTDDSSLLNVSITGSNPDAEFVTAPKSGGVKASKTHRMQIIGSAIANNNGHGVWWDQSNYDALLANSKIVGNRDSGVFYEISHGLTMVNNLVVVPNSTNSTPAVRLAGSSATRLVNNTIVGSQTPLTVAGDARSKTYGSSGRPCSEHSQRYRQGGNVSADCPPGLSSDLDMARTGAYGSPNLTPRLNWSPSASMLVNNVFANPGNGSGGICPGGYPVCVKGYAGAASKPTVAFKTNAMLGGLIMDGNVYQAQSAVAQVRVQDGGSGGVTASSLAQLRSALSSSWYQLQVEGNGLAGTGWVTSSGTPTAALQAKQGQAAPVPKDPVINTFVAAGSRQYGASFTDGTSAAAPQPTESAPAGSTAPAGDALAQDSFERTRATGFGEAEVGGAWSLMGSSSQYAVEEPHGVVSLQPGSGRRAVLPEVSAPSVQTLTAFDYQGSASGGGLYVTVMPRVRPDTSGYRAKVRIDASGSVQLSLAKVAANGANTDLATSETTLSGATSGRTIMVRAEASGTSPTTLSARMWFEGDPEPSGWQVRTTDNTAGLQGPGGVGVYTYLSGSAGAPAEVRLDRVFAKAS